MRVRRGESERPQGSGEEREREQEEGESKKRRERETKGKWRELEKRREQHFIVSATTALTRNDHTTMTAPLPVCSAKLSIVGPG